MRLSLQPQARSSAREPNRASLPSTTVGSGVTPVIRVLISPAEFLPRAMR
jgi:hypothetical protein